MSDVRLDAGQTAPAFTLPDQDGAPVSLADFAGRRVILYFYPEASTPACTDQACELSENLGSLGEAGYAVIGVSRDEIAALKKFQTEQHLGFPLLSNPALDVLEAYGAWGEKNSYGRIVLGTRRSTFVIDETGTIVHALYNVKAKGHLGMLRKKLHLDA
jgi:thioredoxin-dependent peroxiredoxin